MSAERVRRTENEETPSVLIIAVNPLSSTSNNGKTYASIFRGYAKEAIAQLYFHRELPTSDVCGNYFRITDEDVLRAIRSFARVEGARVAATSVAERVVPERVNNLLKRSKAIRLARSLLWRAVSFERGAAKEWLDEVNPDVIFFCGGDSNHLYRGVHRLSRRYNAPIVYYITDDYVLPARSLNPFDAVNRAWTRRVFKKMCRESALVLTIGDEMSRVYEREYGVRSQTAMNMVDVAGFEPVATEPANDPLVLSYLGGLHSNRWRVLTQIAASLERLARHALRGELRVYSGDVPEPAVRALLDRSPYASFRGRVDSTGVRNAIRDSDVLVHVESDDPKSRAVTRLSISTKIPEYMASGKPIVALGPTDIASIRYLADTETAFVASSLRPDSIDAVLTEVLSDVDRRRKLAHTAWTVAKRDHDESVVRPQIQAQIVAVARNAGPRLTRDPA